MNDAIYTLHRGAAPLLVSLPHAGTRIPEQLRHALVPRALQVEDTDWFLDQLYDFVRDMGASLIVPRHSRYVVDVNRPSDNQTMYAGSNNTELCPTRSFNGEPLYRDGMSPSAADVAQRVATYWQPYHDALREELARLTTTHGHAVLFDGHSIKSRLPWLFAGTLPDLNLGTARGTACASSLRDTLAALLRSQERFSVAIDGRFTGGHITRHFGQPSHGVHAVQLEICWSTYMPETPPYAWHAEHAARLQPLLRRVVQAMLDWRPA